MRPTLTQATLMPPAVLAQHLRPGEQIITPYISRTLSKKMYELHYRPRGGDGVLRIVGHSENQCRRALKRRLEWQQCA